MGKRSQERRHQRRHQHTRPSADDRVPPAPSPAASPAELLEQALHSVLTVGPDALVPALDGAASVLAATGERWPALGQALLALGDRTLTRLWAAGWRPADVVRIVRRDLQPEHAALAVDLIAAEARRHPAAAFDRRWAEQLRELEAEVWWGEDDHYLPRVTTERRLDRFAVATHILELLRVWSLLPPITPVGPAPGRAAAGHRGGRSAGEPRMLGRIRALLAKAESTGFPEEAEALTAKAQQLMAQHSIDEALLAAGQADKDAPSAVRIGVDSPYEGPKTMLLDAVAAANRSRAVWSSEFGFCTVVGFDADLDAVELLYTSLLVQATTAMNLAGSRRHAGGASRTRAFRQSFLIAYAARIRERLGAAAQQAADDAAAGIRLREDDPERTEQAVPDARLLPALAARELAVDSATEAMFPRLTSQRVRVSDAEGWTEGRAAADRAAFG
ncbi:DUF2786 domain-containing protein [Peterkaempfera griseoplana]|uniref:DUF2786 domain-containing protein n=1 Tax=Peterkaempfera griseoplana TaxID=66896 RepID=UPI00099EB459|nr:DUF2786 domain-containing protein [Peterkaempfera griseoplana]